jgi:Ni,Fe-hydrogenase III large subunit
MVERLVCSNGLRALVPDAKHSVKIRHTKNVVHKMDEALKVFAESNNFFARFEETARILSQKMVDQKMVESFLDEVIGEESKSTKTKNRREAVVGLFENGLGNKGNTAWDLYNGLTEWVDHHQIKDDDQRFVFSTIGKGVDLKEKAYKVAMSL